MKLETLAKRAFFSAFLLGSTACATGLTDETNTSNGGTDAYGDETDNGENNTYDGGDVTPDSEMSQGVVFRTNAMNCDYNKEGTWIAILTDGKLKPYGYSYPGGNGPSVLSKIGHTPSVPKVCEMKNIYRHINTGDIYIPIGDSSDAAPPPLPYAVFMEEGKKITAYMESQGFNGPLEAEFAELHPCTLRDYMLNHQEIRSAEEVICEDEIK